MPQPVKDRHNTNYTRVIVPEELRSVLGKGEIKRLLKTKDLREAKRLHPCVLSEIHQEFDRARRKLHKVATPGRAKRLKLYVIAG